MRLASLAGVEHRTSSRTTTILILAASMAIAFALRVPPAYSVVFTPDGVNFQENDAWFHLRTVHNLLAHFPHRSAFDPYALFPHGQEIPTGPVWDYMLATPAWLLGLGAPSAALIDHVAAWMPALLGVLFPIPAFFVTRRLFGNFAAVFAALWMAASSGALLWLTHLGLADHHAAEGLFAFLVLTFLCLALESGNARFAWLAGLALGIFMGIRPAGIFIPAILACLVLIQPLASAAVLRASVAAVVVFLPISGMLWSQYSWLSLGGTAALAAIVLALDTMARRRNWVPVLRHCAPFAVLAVGAAAAFLAMPRLLDSLWHEIRIVSGFESYSRVVATVQEMQPVYRAGVRHGWPSIFEELGVIWAPTLAGLIWLPWKQRQPAVLLLALWTTVMGLGTLMMVRMAIYFLPAAAVPAGFACSWLVHRFRPAYRRIVAPALIVLVLALNPPWANSLVRADGGFSTDWRGAFAWLRDHSSDPFGDPGVWWRYYPSERSAAAPEWGVAMWWDDAYGLEEIAHRIPFSNGTQKGAEDMARFYTEAIPEAAVGWLRQAGARYVIVGPMAPMLAGTSHSLFPGQVRMLGRNLDTYLQMLYQSDNDGQLKSVPVYLPTYFQTMTARLYLSNGEAVQGTGPWLFETAPSPAPQGKTMERIVSSRHFDSEAEAGRFVSEHNLTRFTIGCVDPGTSCVTLPAVKGIKLVFTSDPRPLSHDRPVSAVKIFQVLPEN